MSHKTLRTLAVAVAGLIALAAQAATVTVDSLNERNEPIKVEVPMNPTRIAVIDGAVLDNLDHWGVADRVVALPQASAIPFLAKYFEKSDKITDIGNLKEVSMEALMASEPEVIFISGRLAKKYKELSRIAPVVFMTTDHKEGTFKSFEKNLLNTAKIFGKEEQAQKDIAAFTERLKAIRAKSNSSTAAVGMVTSAHVNLLGNAARCSLIGKEFGFKNVAEKANANHGNESSFELLLKLDPEYFFVLDRDSAIARPGAKLAKDVLNNEMVAKMRASRENHIVYLTPSAWYLAEGGYTSMTIMFDDIEQALGIGPAGETK